MSTNRCAGGILSRALSGRCLETLRMACWQWVSWFNRLNLTESKCCVVLMRGFCKIHNLYIFSFFANVSQACGTVTCPILDVFLFTSFFVSFVSIVMWCALPCWMFATVFATVFHVTLLENVLFLSVLVFSQCILRWICNNQYLATSGTGNLSCYG